MKEYRQVKRWVSGNHDSPERLNLLQYILHGQACPKIECAFEFGTGCLYEVHYTREPGRIVYE